MHNYAYALGYYAARALGCYDCPFKDDAERHAYQQGYDRGMADWAEFDEPDEQP